MVPTRHYPLRRNYVFDVTKDMLARGVIRRRHGAPIEEVVRAEAQAIASEIMGDVRMLAAEFSFTLAATGTAALEAFARQQLDAVMGAGKNAIFDFVADAFREGGKRKP